MAVFSSAQGEKFVDTFPDIETLTKRWWKTKTAPEICLQTGESGLH